MKQRKPAVDTHLSDSFGKQKIFKVILQKTEKLKKGPAIDGYKGFWYLDKKNIPEVALHWEKYFELTRAKHNGILKEQLLKPHHMFVAYLLQ